MTSETFDIFDVMFSHETKEVEEISAPTPGHYDYVQQFLNPDAMLNKIQIKPQSEESISEKIDQQYSSQKEKQRDAKCFNHNSQKHTVVTLQHILSIKDFNKNSEEHQIIRKMWSQFTKTKKKTKEILTILFGSFNPQSQQEKNLFEQYNLENILKYSTISIRSAQNMLREAACDQLTQEKIDREIAGRRITSKTHFKKYFMHFLQEIKERPLKMRTQKFKVEKQDQMGQFLNL